MPRKRERIGGVRKRVKEMQVGGDLGWRVRERGSAIERGVSKFKKERIERQEKPRYKTPLKRRR